eukprot:scaffold377762_cov26-Prasinocladus_malaysianus.AAC.1
MPMQGMCVPLQLIGIWRHSLYKSTHEALAGLESFCMDCVRVAAPHACRTKTKVMAVASTYLLSWLTFPNSEGWKAAIEHL